MSAVPRSPLSSLRRRLEAIAAGRSLLFTSLTGTSQSEGGDDAADGDGGRVRKPVVFARRLDRGRVRAASRHQRTGACERLLQPSPHRRDRDRQDAAGDRRKYESAQDVRGPDERAHRGEQLHVARPHRAEDECRQHEREAHAQTFERRSNRDAAHTGGGEREADRREQGVQHVRHTARPHVDRRRRERAGDDRRDYDEIKRVGQCRSRRPCKSCCRRT